MLDIDAATLAFGGSVRSDVGLRDLLGQVPGDAAALLAWVPNIAIGGAGFHFDPTSGGESFTAFVDAGIAGSADASANLFIATVPASAVGPSPEQSTTAFVVGLGLTSSVDLGGTPLFGSLLNGIAVQGLGIVYASQDLPENAFRLPPPGPEHQPAFPQGLVLTLTIAGGGAQQTFTLRPSTAPLPTTATRPSDGAVATADGPEDQPAIQWFTVQKSIGPLTLGRLGILASDDTFGLGLDASITTSVFSVVLTGFVITFPTDRIDLAATTIRLDGLALALTTPSVTLAGTLLRRESAETTEYDGMVTIQVGPFGIAAIGSYADLHGAPTLFVYGVAKGTFGGPPAFFVTGLAAGFGLNRGLRLPGVDAVADHPFVLAAKDGAGFTRAFQMLAEGGWVPPAAGEYWLAAGVQFTSFELVRSFVLVTVQLGHELVFALLGTSAIRLPRSGPAYLYAELAIDAVLNPSAGTLQVTALLTANSFVLDPACHLRGAFAFWLWFGDDEHAGDFVISLGGYHPLFDPPAWYPALPRLGIDWDVSDAVHVTGGAYFALTPSCVMAGGSLALTFQQGALRAWLTAHVDMLIFWKPFYFVAGIGVSVGVSYTLTLGALHRTFQVELGVDVELWGPPVAGVARIKWWVISFTIDINGGGRPQPPGRTLKDWDAFADAFLPPTPSRSRSVSAPGTAPGTVPGQPVVAVPSPLCRPRVARGLLRSLDDDRVWVVAAGELMVTTETVIPATELIVGDPAHPAHRFDGPALGAYPMGSVDVQSRHIVCLDRVLAGGPEPVALDAWSWEPVSGSVPQALWGRQNAGSAELGSETVPALTGSRGAPLPAEPSGPGPISFTVLRYVDLPDRVLPLPTTGLVDGAATPTATDPFDVLRATVMDPVVVRLRECVVAELRHRGVEPDLVAGDLSLLRDEARAALVAPPMIGPLGTTGPRSASATLRHAVASPGGRPPGRRSRTTEQPVGPSLRGVFRRCRTGAPAPAPLGGDTQRIPAAVLLLSSAETSRHLRLAVPRPTVRSGLQRSAGRSTAQPIAADLTAVWDVDAGRAHLVELDGPPRRLIAFDDQQHPLLDLLSSGPVELPAGTAMVVVDEAEAPTSHGRWGVGSRLRRLASQVCLGDGLLVRTQSPCPAPSGRRAGTLCDTVTSRALLAGNRVAGAEPGTSFPGWVDTVVPARMRTVAVELGPADPGRVDTPPTMTLAVGGRPDPGRVTLDPRPAASLAGEGGAEVHVLDLPPAGEPHHLFLSGVEDRRLRRVVAFAAPAAAVLATCREPARRPLRPARSPAPDEPTVVRWR